MPQTARPQTAPASSPTKRTLRRPSLPSLVVAEANAAPALPAASPGVRTDRILSRFEAIDAQIGSLSSPLTRSMRLSSPAGSGLTASIKLGASLPIGAGAASQWGTVRTAGHLARGRKERPKPLSDELGELRS